MSDSWSRNPPTGVAPSRTGLMHKGKVYGLRSTSVGDIFDRDGELFVVDVVGFVSLGFNDDYEITTQIDGTPVSGIFKETSARVILPMWAKLDPNTTCCRNKRTGTVVVAFD